MRFQDTVDKFNAFTAKEPELRKRYLAAMETLQVDLPPADEALLPYLKGDDLFRTAKLVREGTVALTDAALDRAKVAESIEKLAIAEKKIRAAKRELRAITEEECKDLEELLWAFYDDCIHVMHHLKKLSKIENNPEGYYTQMYRRVYAAYRYAEKGLHGRNGGGKGNRGLRRTATLPQV